MDDLAAGSSPSSLPPLLPRSRRGGRPPHAKPREEKECALEQNRDKYVASPNSTVEKKGLIPPNLAFQGHAEEGGEASRMGGGGGGEDG